MSEAKPRGRFVWFDLMTTDPDKAVEFYTKVIGWGTTQWEGTSPYTMWTNTSVPIGGLMPLPPEAGAPPHWLAYISSPDVDGHGEAGRVARREDAGRAQRCSDGRALRGSFGPAGRRVCDLHAVLARRRATRAPAVLGEFSWHELATREQPAAFASTRRCSAGTRPRHGHGARRPCTRCSAGTASSSGGMFNKPPEMPGPPAWTHYIRVDDIEPRRRGRPRPAAARSSTARWKCPAATGSSRPSIPQGAMFAAHAKA